MVKRDAGKQCRIVLFLDMDSLGELAIDMGIMNANLRCTFKCQDQKVFDFMQPLLPELHKRFPESITRSASCNVFWTRISGHGNRIFSRITAYSPRISLMLAYENIRNDSGCRFKI